MILSLLSRTYKSVFFFVDVAEIYVSDLSPGYRLITTSFICFGLSEMAEKGGWL